jgi:hypothetical protein
LALLAAEHTRLLKLFYFCVCEHLRSTDGHRPWELAHDVVAALCTHAEEAELEGEFGPPQPDGIDGRQPVLVGSGGKTWLQCRADELAAGSGGGSEVNSEVEEEISRMTGSRRSLAKQVRKCFLRVYMNKATSLARQ